MQNKKKAIDLLVKKGKDQGFLTQEDLLDIFPTIEDNIELLDNIFEILQENDIEVLEPDDTIAPQEQEELTLEKKIKILKSIQSTLSTDAIRSYLYEIVEFRYLQEKKKSYLQRELKMEMRRQHNY